MAQLPVVNPTSQYHEIGAPSTPSSVPFSAKQFPQAGVIGTSISETLPYRVATSAANNGDGTWTITFGSNPRPEYGEGDIVQVTQGPEGLNTRSAVCTAIAGNVLTVRPDTTLSIPLTGTAPLVYYREQRNFGNYVVYAQGMSSTGFEVAVDAAVGGMDTSQLLQIIDRDFIAKTDQFQFVIAELGTMNSIYARDFTVAQETAYVTTYIDKIAALGKPFYIKDCLPKQATGSWTAPKLDKVIQINAFAGAYIRSKGGVYSNSFKASYGNKSYLDTASANAEPRVTEATTDGTHPNTGGGPLQAAELARWVDSLFKPADFLPSSVKDSVTGLINTNPFMNGTGGAKTGGAGATVTGNVADSGDVVVVTGGADTNIVCSVVARTEAVHGDSIGNSQRLVITTGATLATIEFRFGGNMSASFLNGDYVTIMGAVQSSLGTTPGVGTPLALASTNIGGLLQTATTVNEFIGSNGMGTAAVNQEALRVRVKSPRVAIRGPLAVHGAPTLVRAYVQVYVRANASICIDIGRVGVVKG